MRFPTLTPLALIQCARSWREMHSAGTPKQRADADEQARRNERKAAKLKAVARECCSMCGALDAASAMHWNPTNQTHCCHDCW